GRAAVLHRAPALRADCRDRDCTLGGRGCTLGGCVVFSSACAACCRQPEGPGPDPG
ncbi:unnamed protein product, partial [Effrenium voratum]